MNLFVECILVLGINYVDDKIHISKYDKNEFNNYPLSLTMV